MTEPSFEAIDKAEHSLFLWVGEKLGWQAPNSGWPRAWYEGTLVRGRHNLVGWAGVERAIEFVQQTLKARVTISTPMMPGAIGASYVVRITDNATNSAVNLYHDVGIAMWLAIYSYMEGKEHELVRVWIGGKA